MIGESMNKKGDFTFGKIIAIVLLLMLLLWVIFWYGGLRENIIAMLNQVFK